MEEADKVGRSAETDVTDTGVLNDSIDLQSLESSLTAPNIDVFLFTHSSRSESISGQSHFLTDHANSIK